MSRHRLCFFNGLLTTVLPSVSVAAFISGIRSPATLDLEPLTKKRIGFQSAIIYLLNTLAYAPESSNIESTDISVQLPQHILEFLVTLYYNNVLLGTNSLRRGYEDPPPHEKSYESSLHFRTSNKQRAA